MAEYPTEVARDMFCLFCKGALFRGKGGPPVLEKPARHLPGLLDHPYMFCPCLIKKSQKVFNDEFISIELSTC